MDQYGEHREADVVAGTWVNKGNKLKTRSVHLIKLQSLCWNGEHFGYMNSDDFQVWSPSQDNQHL